jgi:ElaB/YqjD/DUF883 family membrane-anchored ribosome-binding protein
MNAMEQPDPQGATSSTTSGTTPEAIQEDIERTRAQLGRTADALAHKLDPKAQAKEKLEHARARGDAAATHARARAHRAQQTGRRLYRERQPVVIGVAAGVAALLVVAVIWRRNN